MFLPVIRIACIAVLMLLLHGAAHAQNTKGDRPSQGRETRFRKSGDQKIKRSKQRKEKPATGRRRLFRRRAGETDRAGRAANNWRKSTRRNVAEREGKRNVFPQRAPYVNNDSQEPSQDDRRPMSNRPQRKRIQSRSARNQGINIYPQKGPYVNNPSPTPRSQPRAVSNRSKLARLQRLQGPDPRPKSTPRVRPRSASRSYTARRSINIKASFPRGKRKTEKAYTRDISGRPLRKKNFESPGPSIIRTPQGGGAVSVSGRAQQEMSRDRGRYGRYRNFRTRRVSSSTSARRTSPRSISATVRRTNPDGGRYVNNPSKRPRAVERASSNVAIRRRLQGLQSTPTDPRRKKAIVPRSASRSYIARRSTNILAHFPRPKKKGERPYLRDLAGKRLRTRNFETPRREVIPPTFKPYYGRKRIGDRPYRGRTGGYVSATRRSPRAWTGDIAGRKIRGKKTPRMEAPAGAMGKGYRTATRLGERVSARVPVRPPGLGAAGMSLYRGFQRKARRGMRNQGEEYPGNLRGIRKGFGDQGEEYSGNIRKRRGLRNQGEESRGNLRGVRRGFGDQGEEYSGNLRRRRALKNQGEEYAGNLRGIRKGFGNQGEEYTGALKARRPDKGGGTRSGKLWNNQGLPIPTRTPSQDLARAGRYQGSLKAKRPVKGGGSISGKLWNNDGSPIRGKTPPARAAEVAGFPGKMKRFSEQPGFSDQGEEYTGSIKRRRPAKGGGSVSGKLWNNDESPIAVRTPSSRAGRAGEYSGNVRTNRRAYVKNPNASELALRKQRPTKSVFDEGNLQVRVARRSYVKNPNASALALRKAKPTKSTFEEGQLQSRTRGFNYVRNPNSALAALKVREPGQAFGRSSDFQGNIRMQKFTLFEKNRALHPDAKFVKPNKNNVAEEKDALTNLKLWWARLFRKSETQPDHLKEKGKKPRYDEREKGLWYD